ncbi:phage minor head protein [Luteimonas fraxinea]|uniref:Phage head morphogenesis protein n=1 Tax=Luteimonas fraxinea TaxID=2901869 RepID=A0ABS8U9P3_9GAMM|nr:phage minor head protein [Luteimonas fraxinea]MCD9096193.1 phage head morphogenesis protein [Luteimonas fraxinea]
MGRRTSHRKLAQLIEALEPAIRDAFLAAIRSVRERAPVSVIADLIEAGRVDDVLLVLGIDTALLSPLSESVRAAFVAGGAQGVAEMPAIQVALRPVITGSYAARPVSPVLRASFDLFNPRAQSWLANHSSQLVTHIVGEQRTAIQQVLSTGMQLGRNPRQTALDIVGRIGETGRRSGGIVGLTPQQAQYVSNMRADLASGNPRLMARYFKRDRRDKRFDAQVRKAMEAGKPVSQASIDKIAGRYSDRLLQLRGENIARTESMSAFNAARQESFRQAVESGGLRPEHVRKGWGATGDDRTRHSHAELNGMEIGLEDLFVATTGARMLYPGDTEHGAGAEDVAGCRCTAMYRVDMIAATLEQR